jgi:hypothetical protein
MMKMKVNVMGVGRSDIVGTWDFINLKCRHTKKKIKYILLVMFFVFFLTKINK